MKSNAKKTPAKKSAASSKGASKTKTKASKQAKPKPAAGKKSKAGATGTTRKAGGAKAAAKRTGAKVAAAKSKGASAKSKKRTVQKPEEMPVIVHGADHHFIPSHESGTEMPHMDEKILHNRQQVAMNQENQKIKSITTRGGTKRVFRILGR